MSCSVSIPKYRLPCSNNNNNNNIPGTIECHMFISQATAINNNDRSQCYTFQVTRDIK